MEGMTKQETHEFLLGETMAMLMMSVAFGSIGIISLIWLFTTYGVRDWLDAISLMGIGIVSFGWIGFSLYQYVRVRR